MAEVEPGSCDQNGSAVMIVDDEPPIRSLFVDVLTRRGFRVVSCGSGQEALDRLADGDIGLVFLDIRMAGLNGVVVLEEVKERFPDVHVVMITGYASPELEQRMAELRPLAVLRKPFGVADILRVARQAPGLENREPHAANPTA